MNKSLASLFVMALYFLLASDLFAEMLSQPFFRIEVDHGWAHSIQQSPDIQGGFGDLITLHHPNRSATLKIRSLHAPAISRTTLREMTNVDSSEQLDWELWGEFSGYEYSYFENDSFHRQWWLTDGIAVVFFVYSSTDEPGQAENDAIEKTVRSIRSS